MHLLPLKKELNITSLFFKVKGIANNNLASSTIYLSPIRCTSSSYWDMSGHNLSTDTRFMCFLSRLLVSHRYRDQKQHHQQQSSQGLTIKRLNGQGYSTLHSRSLCAARRMHYIRFHAPRSEIGQKRLADIRHMHRRAKVTTNGHCIIRNICTTQQQCRIHGWA